MSKQKAAADTSQRKITVFFGYTLFIAAIAAVIASTIIPWSTLLFSPGVRHLNVLSTLFAFVAAAIVPFLVAYIIGDKTTRSKNKLTHHYNGVLFGVMAYWLSLFFSSVGSYTIAPIRKAFPEFWVSSLVNSWPILATIIVIAIVAVAYHARKQKAGESVLQYRPYQLLLLLSFIAPFTLTLPQLVDGQLLSSVLNIGVPAVFIGISYATLKKAQSSKRARLTHAIIAVTFGILTMQFVAQLIHDITYNTFTTFALIAMGAAVWVLYLRLSVRFAKKIR